MPGPLQYADAVRLLGGGGPLVDALDRAVGGALLAAAGPVPDLVLGLLGGEARLGELSRGLVTGLAERLDGLGRFDRTQRLAAAHAVIVVAAYGDVVAETALPFDVRELRMSRGESVHVVTGAAAASDRPAGLAGHLLRSALPVPSPVRPYEETLRDLRAFYRTASALMTRYVEGCAVWDGLPEEDRDAVRRLLDEEVPDRAVERYEEHLRRLIVDVPEVGVWADRLEHASTRNVLRAGLVELAGVTEALRALAAGPRTAVAEAVLALRSLSAEALTGPVIGAADALEGLSIPSLHDAYVSPDFRLREFAVADRLAEDRWWEGLPARPGLDEFLGRLLLSPRATEAPLLLLGQPGAGKSLLTKVLAARLPAADFLAVRVPLRDVPADAGVQEQIEAALLQATGERLDWPDLVRAADGALPVVLLDGFDELLQATGLNQSDYLERVAAFQRREVALGRPLAVLVTSRTVVADRARLTPGGLAIRIEAFSEAQTKDWLDRWNTRNAPYFRDRGLAPLAERAVLAQPALAAQPLLLMMIALYDAQENAFQRDADALAGFGLYERLLSGFARREVLKLGAARTDEDLERAVEAELLRLSVAAAGMFNRGRQWVTEAELDADLGVLVPDHFAPVPPAGLRAPLGKGEATLGRFFFVHHAEAFRDAAVLRSYEFLHATFGEFLVARLAVREVLDLAAERAEHLRRPRRPAPDDSFLHAVLSFAPLTSRAAVVSFVVEVLGGLDDGRRHQARELVRALLGEALRERRSAAHAEYRPGDLTVPARHASYASNLLVLLLATGPVTGSELFPDRAEPVEAWRRLVQLVKSQMSVTAWRDFAGWLVLVRRWRDGEPEVELRLGRPGGPQPGVAGPGARGSGPDDCEVDVFWTLGWGPGHAMRPSDASGFFGWQHRDADELLRDAFLLCDEDGDTLVHAVQALSGAGLTRLLTGFASTGGDGAASSAHLLLKAVAELLVEGAQNRPPRTLGRLLWALYAFDPGEPQPIQDFLMAVVRLWRLAGHEVPEEWVRRAVDSVEQHKAGLAVLIRQLAGFGPEGSEDWGPLLTP
ncbi:hypothetical protein [Streptomyces sp. NPDC089919]|uniref:NACHT domain-containing protein n=1 Tax=Streptomyces sp. NPDC089919 TaxID=3155188 RepID=UPI00343F6213